MKLKKPKFWDQNKPNLIALLLWPLTIFYSVSNKLRKENITHNKEIKTICVGNIYVGGTGKTSLAIHIKELLEESNFRVCFIKKYYSDQIDEQKILSNQTKLFCQKKRIESLKEAILAKFDYAIFDDGLQDESINYDLKLVCFNKLNWVGNGMLIPAGPMREKLINIEKYDAIILNGNDENSENIQKDLKKINSKKIIFNSTYQPTNINNLKANCNYLAFSGIGNHNTFINMLKINDLNILKDLEFPDHYKYSENDLKEIISLSRKLNAKILTTEKDIVKIDEVYARDMICIKSRIHIENQKKFLNLILMNNENN
tara:strand:- start:5584 stop:6528 length:945 start_codon:yes stop_codon:yes gene_type:complete